jgi:hypothetical protein
MTKRLKMLDFCDGLKLLATPLWRTPSPPLFSLTALDAAVFLCRLDVDNYARFAE